MSHSVEASPRAGRVVITGSSGFIGSWLLRNLVRRGHDVVGIDKVDREGLYADGAWVRAEILELGRADLAALRPDVLVHLAEPASVGKSFEDIRAECRDGLLGTAHVIDLWRALPGLRLVYVSSAAVYGDRNVHRCTESLEARPLSPYGAFKAAAENLIRIMGARHQQPYVIVRPFSVYGPGLHKQVIYDVTKRMLAAPTPHLEITGTGREERDFVYVDDCCDAIAGLLRLPASRSPVVNIGTGRSTTLRALVRLLRELTGANVSFGFKGVDAPGNPRRLVASVDRLHHLGIACPTKVRHGLRLTVQAITESGARPLAPALGR